ncbi:hypothetical protein RRG08_055434 [Elysia crispata]|uniref:Uncharacterized protein n=1 Tax=Elysia crispata TaxID=231223 RepID=A0AAE1AQH7_9GAST|nr:hypothetical protein RRG08_055434 [Elysia crispata]
MESGRRKKEEEVVGRRRLGAKNRLRPHDQQSALARIDTRLSELSGRQAEANSEPDIDLQNTKNIARSVWKTLMLFSVNVVNDNSAPTCGRPNSGK